MPQNTPTAPEPQPGSLGSAQRIVVPTVWESFKGSRASSTEEKLVSLLFFLYQTLSLHKVGGHCALGNLQRGIRPSPPHNPAKWNLTDLCFKTAETKSVYSTMYQDCTCKYSSTELWVERRWQQTEKNPWRDKRLKNREAHNCTESRHTREP